MQLPWPLLRLRRGTNLTAPGTPKPHPLPHTLLQENLKGLLADLMEHHWEQLQVRGVAGGPPSLLTSQWNQGPAGGCWQSACQEYRLAQGCLFSRRSRPAPLRAVECQHWHPFMHVRTHAHAHAHHAPIPCPHQAVDYCEVFRNMHIKHEQNQVGAAYLHGVRRWQAVSRSPAPNKLHSLEANRQQHALQQVQALFLVLACRIEWSLARMNGSQRPSRRLRRPGRPTCWRGNVRRRRRSSGGDVSVTCHMPHAATSRLVACLSSLTPRAQLTSAPAARRRRRVGLHSRLRPCRFSVWGDQP